MTPRELSRRQRPPVQTEHPREFGRDGISGVVSADRAVRAREVSRPSSADRQAAELVVEQLVARASGRRR